MALAMLAVGMHNDIISMFEYCCHQTGKTGEDLTMFINSLRIPANTI